MNPLTLKRLMQGPEKPKCYIFGCQNPAVAKVTDLRSLKYGSLLCGLHSYGLRATPIWGHRSPMKEAA
jgi:hypothetical protein